MKNVAPAEIWFLTGSQNLYGADILRTVAEESEKIVGALNGSKTLPAKLVFKPVLKSPDEIRRICLDANSADECAGVVLWMHTFSPSKMWIRGLTSLAKPFLHLHTQFHRDIPWQQIDMDYMNLHQSAHGDREAGFIHTRMRLNRKVVVGHWTDPDVQQRMAAWTRGAGFAGYAGGEARAVRRQYAVRRGDGWG